MYLLGYDIGSSSVKVALVEAKTGTLVRQLQYPEQEMPMTAHQSGWAEQAPEDWWQALCIATQQLLQLSTIDPSHIASIGIAYQMHGLVLIGQEQQVLRPAIIWCDSRAVEIGAAAFNKIGKQKCLTQLLNSPANFTASKLKWVQENEPEVYAKIDKLLLPGDYIAMRLSGQVATTLCGLSEAILWDFPANAPADLVLEHFAIDRSFLPDLVPTYGEVQARLSEEAAKQTGLKAETPICYRAGDQPNNALALGVARPGEVAASGGTSGVVYGLVDEYIYDQDSRINSFAHVNHSTSDPRIGLLLCINGAGSQYAWIKRQLAATSYDSMEEQLQEIPVGAEGLRMLPFGNGAERMLGNANIGAQLLHLEFNRHSRAHLYRAGLEGIAFSFVYGFQLLKDLGLSTQVIKVGNDNLFQSAVFATTIAQLLNCRIEVIDTSGAAGAAKASGIGIGIYENLEAAFDNLEVVKHYDPLLPIENYREAYDSWQEDLLSLLP